MAKLPEITIEVAPGGGSTLEVNGCTGKACTNLTKQIEESLGGAAGERELKPEHKAPETYERTRATQQGRQQQR